MMNSDSIVKAITVCVAVVCAGCRDEAGREPEHATSDNGDPAVVAVETEIGKCRQMLDVGGWNAAIWSSSVAKSILALDDASQQKRLVDAYLAHLAALNPLTDTHKEISTSLFNYSMMLDAYLQLYRFPDAEEKLFGLMCRCIRLYRMAINNLAVEVEGKPASQRYLDLKHERSCLTGDLRAYSNYVERTYFPWALSHGMLKARHDHWRSTFLDAFTERPLEHATIHSAAGHSCEKEKCRMNA